MAEMIKLSLFVHYVSRGFSIVIAIFEDCFRLFY